MALKNVSFILVMLTFLCSCAAKPDIPTKTAEPQIVELHVLSRENWIKKAEYPIITRALANPTGNVCQIYVPEHDIPPKDIWAHELHHCQMGDFHE